ncbi:HlyD family secretion protein [Methyloceanibacter sp.]|uniref:HlyD family secretion protein n=1 Tax=Methyloceanibacter sp. TaxID=1965321 RepID=UPI002D659DCB|nr:HlyD family secretion protein [Methyloceanibacter sp.]HZP09061.1 HlyD family secretion protein [Methyloceanibacter sp.]
MFRERGNAALADGEAPALADDAAGEPSSFPEGAKSPKARRLTALKTVDEAPARPAPAPSEPPAAPPAEEPAATPDTETETPKPADAELAPAPARRPLRRLVLMFGVVAALAAGIWYGHYYWTVGRFIVSTDDAYVGAKTATIGAKVSGYVTEVAIDDNAHVRAGDVLVRIDDGDYALAVQTAKDNIATEQATIDRIGEQIKAQQAAVAQAKAQLASAQAGQTRAELELTRQQALSAKEFASHQTLEQAQAARDQAVAAVQAAQAQVEAAEANIDVLKGQQNEAENTLKQFRTALAKAMRDLSFTVIRAPFDGVMGNRAVQVGDYVQPGTRLATLVPLAGVYIDANFKETQLEGLKPGQTADISVDALPGRSIEGKVVSVAPASGSVFSLLPPDNATGNFTKIVQRVPVRIEVPATVAGEELLRPGMSVVVSINTKTPARQQSAQR